MCVESIISIKIGYAEFTKAQIEKMVAWLALTVSIRPWMAHPVDPLYNFLINCSCATDSAPQIF